MSAARESCGKGNTTLAGTKGYRCIGEYIRQNHRNQSDNRVILAPASDVKPNGGAAYQACAECPAWRALPTETEEKK